MSDTIKDLSRRMLSALPTLNYGLFPPHWMLGEDEMPVNWREATAEIVQPLWDRAVQEIEKHGYGGVAKRLENLNEDIEKYRNRAKRQRERAVYFDSCAFACSEMVEAHGAETEVRETARTVSRDELGPEWRIDFRHRSKEGDKVWIGLRLEIPDEMLPQLGVETHPPLQVSAFRFYSETWQEAYDKVEIRVRAEWQAYNEAERILSLAEFQAEVIHRVLERDRLIGPVPEWAEMGQEDREGLTKPPPGQADELPQIAEKLEEYLKKKEVSPEDDEAICVLFGNKKTSFHRWIGEQSNRHGSGDARSTGRRLVEAAGALFPDPNRRQASNLPEEVRALLGCSSLP